MVCEAGVAEAQGDAMATGAREGLRAFFFIELVYIQYRLGLPVLYRVRVIRYVRGSRGRVLTDFILYIPSRAVACTGDTRAV